MTPVDFTKKLGAEMLDYGGAHVNVRHPAFGAVLDGTTNDRAALVAAVARAQATGRPILVPGGTLNVATAYTVPADVVLVLDGNAKLKGPLTLACEIVAGNRQVFDGFVRLSGKAAANVNAAWYAGVTESLLDSLDGAVAAGRIGSSDLNAGPTDVAALTQGSGALEATIWARPTSGVWTTFPSNQALAGHVEIAVDVSYAETGPGWGDYDTEDAYALYAADGVGLTGNVVSAPVLPQAIGATQTLRLDISQLAHVRSFGIKGYFNVPGGVRRRVTIDNVRFSAAGGGTVAFVMGAESVVALPDYTTPALAPELAAPEGGLLDDMRPDYPDISGFRRTRFAGHIPTDPDVDVTSAVQAFLNSGERGERLVLRGKYRTDYLISILRREGVVYDFSEAEFYGTVQGANGGSIRVDDCLDCKFEGGGLYGYRRNLWNGSVSANVVGSTVSGTTRVLDAQGDRLRLASTNDLDLGVGWYPYYLLEQFPADVRALIAAYDPAFERGSAFAFTFSDSAQVANDWLFTAEQAEYQGDTLKTFRLLKALDSSQTTYTGGAKDGPDDIFGEEKWRFRPGTYIRIDNEIILIVDSAKNNDAGSWEWTFQRGALGTTVTAHAVGAAITRVVAHRTITATAGQVKYVLPVVPSNRFNKYWVYAQKLTASANVGTLHSYETFGSNYYNSTESEGRNLLEIGGASRNIQWDGVRLEGAQTDFLNIAGGSRGVRIRGLWAHGAARQGIAITNAYDTWLEDSVINGVARSGVDIEPADNGWPVRNANFKNVDIWNSNNANFVSQESARAQIDGIFVNGLRCYRQKASFGGRNVYIRNLFVDGTELQSESLQIWADNTHVDGAILDGALSVEADVNAWDAVSYWYPFTATTDDYITIGGVAPGQFMFGIDNGHPVVLRGAALGAGLTRMTVYYVVQNDSAGNRFKLATSRGGTPIDITGAGSGEIKLSDTTATGKRRPVRFTIRNSVHQGREDIDRNASGTFQNMLETPLTWEQMDAFTGEYGKPFETGSLERVVDFTPAEAFIHPRSFGGDFRVMHTMRGMYSTSLGGTPLMDVSALTASPRIGTILASASRSVEGEVAVDLGAGVSGSETHGKIRVRVARTGGSESDARALDVALLTSHNGVDYWDVKQDTRLADHSLNTPNVVWFVADVRRFIKLTYAPVGGAISFEADYEFWPAGNNFVLPRATVAAAATSAAVTFPNFALPLVHLSAALAAQDHASGALGAGTYYYRVAHRTWMRGPAQWSPEETVVIASPNDATRIRMGRWIRGDWLAKGIYANGLSILRGTTPGSYNRRYDILPATMFGRLATGNVDLYDLGTTLAIGNDVHWRRVKFPTIQTGSWSAVDESGWEPDADYDVVVGGFSWNAGGCWITNKTRSGFTINVENAAPGGGGTCLPMLVR